jgi:dipeptidase E
VRLYLSSFRTGDHPECLISMSGLPARAVVIANAMDDAPTELRGDSVKREIGALGDLGVEAVELDLRDYFAAGQQQRAAGQQLCEDGQQQRASGQRQRAAGQLRDDLAGYELAWLRGGNVFMLRYALARSGGDIALLRLLAADELVYAGYSAGACVLAPSLRGLETVDDAGAVSRCYGEEPIWDGLDVLDYALVPHCDSPDHPENAGLELVAERYQAAGIAHRKLRDGQALVIRDGHVKLA